MLFYYLDKLCFLHLCFWKMSHVYTGDTRFIHVEITPTITHNKKNCIFPQFILVSKYVRGHSIFLVLLNGFVYIWVFIASCLQRIFLFLCSQLKTSPINLLYLYWNLLFFIFNCIFCSYLFICFYYELIKWILFFVTLLPPSGICRYHTYNVRKFALCNHSFCSYCCCFF